VTTLDRMPKKRCETAPSSCRGTRSGHRIGEEQLNTKSAMRKPRPMQSARQAASGRQSQNAYNTYTTADVVETRSHIGNHRTIAFAVVPRVRRSLKWIQTICSDRDDCMAKQFIPTRFHRNRQRNRWILGSHPHEEIDFRENICRDLPSRKIPNIEPLPVGSRPSKRQTIGGRPLPKCAGIPRAESSRPRKRQENCEDQIAQEKRRALTEPETGK
jgi:hypothetical protein